MYLYPYNTGSKGAKALCQALGMKRIKRTQSRFRGRPDKTVINWGNATLPDQVNACTVLNKPEAVNKAGNKLLAFETIKTFNTVQAIPHDHMGEEEIKHVNIPAFTEDKAAAEQWLADGCTVVERSVLRGHSGAGISIANTADDLADAAPLYVKYVKKTQEYRVHVFRDNAFDIQRKARRQDTPDDQVDWQVRNHDNGFIFMREGVELPDVAIEQAKLAIEALGLDFGAVDLIYNQREDKYYVLEVNTAPGLTGTTLEKYAEAFNEV